MTETLSIKEKPLINMIVEPLYSSTHWYRDFLLGISNRLHNRTCLNIPELTESSDKAELEKIASGLCPHTRNIIITGTSTPWLSEAAACFSSSGIHPVIVCSQPPDIRHNLSYISFDHADASYEITRYLLSLGRKKTAFIGMNPESKADKSKLEGFKLALAESGQPPANDSIFINRGCLSECLSKFTARYRKYDAAVCSNDYVAVSLINELTLSGVSLPDDLYITGFGDTITGRICRPSLTTATLDFYEAGRKAADLFLYLDRNPLLKSLSVRVACSIKIRASTENLISDKMYSSPDSSQNAVLHTDRFYRDPSISSAIRLEHLLQQCDNYDGLILCEMSDKVKYEDMADHLSMSEKTIQYRLNKMLAITGEKTKQDLLFFIERLLGAGAGKRISEMKRTEQENADRMN